MNSLKPCPTNALIRKLQDYSSWDQTEADYQREQAAWLAKVARRKKQKTDKLK
ncbi:MAG: hypothetical protein R2860_08590 [Desulfobacterales bacterium]